MRDITIIAFNASVVTTDEGEQFPVTNMIDADGEDTNDFEQATVLVISFGDDKWGTFDITEFEPVTLQ